MTIKTLVGALLRWDFKEAVVVADVVEALEAWALPDEAGTVGPCAALQVESVLRGNKIRECCLVKGTNKIIIFIASIRMRQDEQVFNTQAKMLLLYLKKIGVQMIPILYGAYTLKPLTVFL